MKFLQFLSLFALICAMGHYAAGGIVDYIVLYVISVIFMLVSIKKGEM